MRITLFLRDTLRRHPLLYGGLFLTAITLLNNWPMAFFDFAWDDQSYVVTNYAIQKKPGWDTLVWAITHYAEANWHPVTWIALNIEHFFFGLLPFGYHIVNLILHTVNAILIFVLLSRTTGKTGCALTVALLFSIHPLHIESVAWITEIKDILSTFFLLLTLFIYTKYSKTLRTSYYILTCITAILGLMAKPMLVTLPFILLLLDYWPLARWVHAPAPPSRPTMPLRDTKTLLLEKTPFVFFSLTVSVITFLAQRAGGAMAPLDTLPLATRLYNALHSYVAYLWRLFYPWPLSFFYPYDEHIPAWKIVFCALVLCAISTVVFAKRNRTPYLLMGWLWFIGTLIPVIGLVQVGTQAMADRYMYIPSIGLFIALTWLLAAAFERFHLKLLPVPLIGAAALILMITSLQYLQKWSNELDLYTYALEIDPTNTIAHNNLGVIYFNKQEFTKAIHHFESADSSGKHKALFYDNIGISYVFSGNIEKGCSLIDHAYELFPDHPLTLCNYSLCLMEKNNFPEAEKTLVKALSLDPSAKKAFTLYGILLTQQKRFADAIALYNKALAATFDTDPVKTFFINSQGLIYLHQQQYAEAIEAFAAATRLQKNPYYDFNLARAYYASNDPGNAETVLRALLAHYPGIAPAHALLARVLADQGKNTRAIFHYRRAIAANAADADSHDQLSRLYASRGLAEQASTHRELAASIRKQPPPTTAQPGEFSQRLPDGDNTINILEQLQNVPRHSGN